MRKTSASTIQESQKRIAASGGQHLGDLATWNADGVDVPREEVRAIFEREGFMNVAAELEPASALRRAVGETGKVPGLVVNEFALPIKGSAAFGVYVVQANSGETGDGYTCGARVRINAQGRAVAMAPEGGVSIEEALVHAENITERANHLMAHAKTVDVSGALISAVKTLGGIPLRDRGGFYLIPVPSCERWRRLAAAVEPFGIRQILIEMHDAPSNMKAVAGAAKSSLEEEIGKLKEDLEKALGEGMRKSSLDRRIRACEALVAKADLYRNVLQEAAGSIEKKVEALKAGFVKALEDSDTPEFKATAASA